MKINNDPVTAKYLQIAYPPNYNVSMAEDLIPAADLSEQISTAGKEASGTGNMKFTMNGALTIGTLDGANVEIRDLVGPENFFLFGLKADEAAQEAATPGHARRAIERSQDLKDALHLISEGRFGRAESYYSLLDRTWNDDPFLVASDFDSYFATQRAVDRAYADHAAWDRMAALNIARSGFFSSDRTIRGYMNDIWQVRPVALYAGWLTAATGASSATGSAWPSCRRSCAARRRTRMKKSSGLIDSVSLMRNR